MVSKPSFDDAEKLAEIKSDDNSYVFAAILPQIGGYCSQCIVEFDKYSNDMDGGPGCFDVSVFHNGDFPQDEKTINLHFCSAEQIIRFGITVLLKQAEHQKKGRLLKSEKICLIRLVESIPVYEK